MLDENWLVYIEGKTNIAQLNFRQKVALLKLLPGSQYVTDEEIEMICERGYRLIAKGQIFDAL